MSPSSSYAASSKGELMKLRIVESSVACIAGHGLEGGLLERVAKTLKVRRSHVAYYFPQASALFEAAVRHSIAQGQRLTLERLAEASDPEACVRAMVEAAFLWADRYPAQVKVLLLFYHSCSSDPASRAFHTELRAAGWRRLQELLLRSAPRGSAPDEAGRTALSIQCLITGGILESLTTQSSPGKPEVASATVHHCLALARVFWKADRPAGAGSGKGPGPRLKPRRARR